MQYSFSGGHVIRWGLHCINTHGNTWQHNDGMRKAAMNYEYTSNIFHETIHMNIYYPFIMHMYGIWILYLPD